MLMQEQVPMLMQEQMVLTNKASIMKREHITRTMSRLVTEAN
jgi:hypothetical protein